MLCATATTAAPTQATNTVKQTLDPSAIVAEDSPTDATAVPENEFTEEQDPGLPSRPLFGDSRDEVVIDGNLHSGPTHRRRTGDGFGIGAFGGLPADEDAHDPMAGHNDVDIHEWNPSNDERRPKYFVM